MKRFVSLALMIAAATALGGGGCDRGKPAPPPVAKKTPPAQKTEWSPEEIAKDPEGYIKWSKQRVASQIAERESKLAALDDRRKVLEEKQTTLNENIEAVANIRMLLERAVKRAEDNDDWPAKMGGRTFSREKAQQILTQTENYAKEREPLKKTYDELFARMDGMRRTVEGDIASLRRLNEKLDVDLESVRLNAGMADADKLRKTENELSAMATAVAQQQNDPMAIVPPREPPGKVNVDDMLK